MIHKFTFHLNQTRLSLLHYSKFAMRFLYFISIISIFSFISPVYAGALPSENGHKSLGNVTCGNSFCHEAKVPWKTSAIPQNEFITWSSKDSHQKAYEALSSDKGKLIAKKLGLKKPAQQESKCLDCHSNNVPLAQRTRTFNIEDGVSCESCHGGADQWLETHVSGAGDHKDNLLAGMFPTEEPVSRATLCMSCHIGNNKKFVTHRMIAAGHPRLVFELDTYTASEPAHYVVNDEYKKRKITSSAIQTWAIGQAMSVKLLMDGITNASRFRKSAYPELSFFDCNSCHHKMSDKRWLPRKETQTGPGVPRLNTANLVMLQIIAKHIEPNAGNRLKQEMLDLHQSTTKNNSQTEFAAKAISTTATKLITTFSQYSFSHHDLIAMLKALVDESSGNAYLDYVAAEQSTLALSTILAGLHRTEGINEADFKKLDKAMDPIYKSVASDEQYQPNNFKSALIDFQTATQDIK